MKAWLQPLKPSLLAGLQGLRPRASHERRPVAEDTNAFVFLGLKEGGTVGFAAFFIPKIKPRLEEVLLISVVAAATFSVIDLFAPSISPHARQGAGFGIGASMYNWPPK